MKSYVRFGLYLAATSILFSLLIYGLGYDMKPIGQKLNFIYYLITLVFVVMGIKYRRQEELGGYISFGQAFKYGFSIVLIGTLVSTVYTWLYVKLLNPGIFAYILEQQEEQMLEQGLSEEQIEMSISMTEKFMTPVGFVLMALLASLFTGLIITLIVAAIMKKNNPNASAIDPTALDA